MKKILLTAVMALFAFQIFAQVKISLRGGFSNAWATADSIVSSTDTFGLTDLKGGFHIGLAAQLKIKKLFIQPEILFNSSSANYSLSRDGAKSAIKDSYTDMDIPIIIGYKSGSFRAGLGPVGHVSLNRKSELLQEGGFNEAMKNMTYGGQFNVGLDLWKVQLDLKYEYNFDDFDSFIDFNGSNSSRPQRIILTAGYIF